MTTFEVCIRSVRKDGYAQTYIRLIHNSKPDYIKTNFVVDKKKVRSGKVIDQYVLVECSVIIKGYMNKLNGVKTDNWTVSQVKEFILRDGSDISFTDFADEFINKMIKQGRDAPAGNYRSSVNSLKKFMRKENIFFSDITSKIIKKWIESLQETSRAKNMYPTSIKTIFDAGLEKYNDYDNGIIIIKNMPFRKDMIPDSDTPLKRSVERRVLKSVFKSTATGGTEELARDVSKLIFYLAGINAVDLYKLEHSNYVNGKLCYNRSKTKNKRKDKAYFEITVPDEIKPLLTKYKGVRLFNFSERYYTSKEFCKAVNTGLKRFGLTTYVFRHSWATIAQNICGASTELVAYCLNHSSAHKEAEGYIRKDFSRVDVLNNKVIRYINGKSLKVGLIKTIRRKRNSIRVESV